MSSGIRRANRFSADRKQRHRARASAENLESRRLLSFSLDSATLLSPELTAGTKWTYTNTNVFDTSNSVVTVAGADTFDGHPTTRVDTVFTYVAGSNVGLISYESHHLAVVDNQTISYGYTASSTQGPSDTFTDSLYSLILPPTLAIGQSYSNSFSRTGVYVFSDRPTVTQISDVTLSFTLNSETLQSITVPAGTFNCYEVDVTSSGVVRDPHYVLLDTDRVYYAPGVGQVKVESNITNAGTHTVTELTSFVSAQHKLTFSQGPADTPIGQTLPPVVVQLLNADGNLDATGSASSKTVTLAISGDGVIRGTTSVAAVGGIATFSDLSVSNSGAYKLTASSDDTLTSATSDTFNITGEAASLIPAVAVPKVPSSAISGGKINLSANITVTNNTDANIIGTAKVAAFLVGPSDLNAAAARNSFTALPASVVSLPIGKPISQRVNIKAHRAARVTMHLTSLPSVTVGGQYAIRFVVTDPQGHAATVTGPSINVGPKLIALTETIAALKLPSTLTIGQKLKAASIKLIVKNSGNVIAAGKSSFNVSASTVAGVVGTTIITAPMSLNLNLAPGKTKPVTINIKTLPALAAGSYFIVVQATDSTGNKSFVSSSLPIAVTA